MAASRRSSVPSVSSAFLNVAEEGMVVDEADATVEGDLAGIDEGDEEEGDEEVEFDGDETAVEEEGEDFTQEFDQAPTVPGTPARSVRTVPATPARTPARSRATPKTPGTVKSNAVTPRPKKKKKKARKSDALDLSALTNEQAALAALESNHILHLRLRKKYYAEGLAFIRLVEGSVDILSQLLASTSKAEVLESMEFFRVAHEYQFDSAHVRSSTVSSRQKADGNSRLVSKR